jgi:hypothetical protein
MNSGLRCLPPQAPEAGRTRAAPAPDERPPAPTRGRTGTGRVRLPATGPGVLDVRGELRGLPHGAGLRTNGSDRRAGMAGDGRRRGTASGPARLPRVDGFRGGIRTGGGRAAATLDRRGARRTRARRHPVAPVPRVLRPRPRHGSRRPPRRPAGAEPATGTRGGARPLDGGADGRPAGRGPPQRRPAPGPGGPGPHDAPPHAVRPRHAFLAARPARHRPRRAGGLSAPGTPGLAGGRARPLGAQQGRRRHHPPRRPGGLGGVTGHPAVGGALPGDDHPRVARPRRPGVAHRRRPLRRRLRQRG